MAMIRKRGELQWQATVKRKGYPTQIKTFPYKREAEEWAADREREIRTGALLSSRVAESTAVSELIARYRRDVLPDKRGNWISGALTALDAAFGKHALSALTSKSIAEKRAAWMVSGLSASTVRQRINLLSKIIDLAGKEWGIPLAANPCAMVSRPAENDARDRRLDDQEEVYLLAASSQHMQWIIKLAVQTAARLGELLALRWCDVDLVSRVIVLRGIEQRGTKNDDAFRAVPLSPAAVSVLRAALPTATSDRVFKWWRASDSFNKSWVRAVKRARKDYEHECEAKNHVPVASVLVDLRFHDLRHEATSRLFERGVFDSMEVASITGHKTLSMLKRYTHLKATNLAKKMDC